MRNVAWLILGFAALMLALTAYVRYSGMLWMDVPLALLGAGLLIYSVAAAPRVDHA